MSQTPITVTYSLEEILGEIKQSIKDVHQKLDVVQKDFKDVTDLKELSEQDARTTKVLLFENSKCKCV